jgi:hypothetical protein
MPSRLKSSMTLNVRNRTPQYRLSDMKSADQTWSGPAGTSNGMRSRLGSRRFVRRRRFRLSAQYTGHRRLWFQGRPGHAAP